MNGGRPTNASYWTLRDVNRLAKQLLKPIKDARRSLCELVSILACTSASCTDRDRRLNRGHSFAREPSWRDEHSNARHRRVVL